MFILTDQGRRNEPDLSPSRPKSCRIVQDTEGAMIPPSASLTCAYIRSTYRHRHVVRRWALYLSKINHPSSRALVAGLAIPSPRFRRRCNGGQRRSVSLTSDGRKVGHRRKSVDSFDGSSALSKGYITQEHLHLAMLSGHAYRN